MTAQSAIPLKWYVPFAQGDSSRVELPVTTSDPTRASQTLGFPPLTMQPPESGGVPPQGEDFNGGLNQVARIAWWVLNGGGWPYDSTFATNSNINGYPNGARLQAADFRGDWINTADNNQNNPDTNGTNWVPGFQYGTTALTGQTGGTVTLTPAQAAKGSITVAGALGSALTLIVPNWIKNWTFTNNTTGAFVTIVKTAAGSGITIPQTGQPTRISGDGTNITQSPENVASATTAANPATLAQLQAGSALVGRGSGILGYTSGGLTTFGVSAWDSFVVSAALSGTAYKLNFPGALTFNGSTTGANGMDTGGIPASAFVALYVIYNPVTAAIALLGQSLATNTIAPAVYGGANMPSGYTASGLIAVLRTNGSSQLLGCRLTERTHSFPSANVLSATTATNVTTYTTLSLSAVVPGNARMVSGSTNMASTGASATNAMYVAGDVNGVGEVFMQGFGAGGGQFRVPNIVGSNQIYYKYNTTAGTTSYIINLSGYEI